MKWLEFYIVNSCCKLCTVFCLIQKSTHILFFYFYYYFIRIFFFLFLGIYFISWPYKFCCSPSSGAFQVFLCKSSREKRIRPNEHFFSIRIFILMLSQFLGRIILKWNCHVKKKRKEKKTSRQYKYIIIILSKHGLIRLTNIHLSWAAAMNVHTHWKHFAAIYLSPIILF